MNPRIPHIKEEDEILWPEKDTYLYLGWVGSNTISGLAMSSSSLHLPLIVESNLFSLLNFFTSNFFIFSSEFFLHELQLQIEKSSVIVLRKDGILIASKERASTEREILKDIDKEKICPLRHLLSISRSLDKKKLNSFLLAIEHGFPEVDLVDFSRKTIKSRKKRITSKWNSMVTDQKGSLEEDFVRTLRYALKSLESEHYPLFEKVYSIVPPGEYSEFSLAPLFGLLPYMTPKKSRTAPIQPKIGIKFLRFEAIFELEEEKISDFLASLEIKLFSSFFEVRINEMGRFQLEDTEELDKKYYRVRVSFVFEIVSNPINLEDSALLAKDLAYLVEEALYEISSQSHEKFKKHVVPEFWLKNAGIAVRVPYFMVSKIRRTVRDYFGSCFDVSQPMKVFRKSDDQFEVAFNLYFSIGYDYVIETRNEGFFPDVKVEDPYTKIGIEYLMRKEFNQAMKYFRRAKSGLLGDYFSVTSFSRSPKEQLRFINRMKKYWSVEDIPLGELLSSSIYTDESDPNKILSMLEVTDDWIHTATSLRHIEILEKQIRLLHLKETEYARAMETTIGRLKKIKNRFFKNFFNFVEDIGSFYVNLLQEIEKEAPESVKEWMRLKI